MRIAVVHSFYSSAQPSGENSVVLDQVATLRSAGHEVLLISAHTDDLSQEPCYVAKSAIVTISGRGRSPAKELKSFSPDVVHLHNSFPNFGVSWTREWSDRLVMTLHNYRPICAAGTLFRDGHDCTECLSDGVRRAVKYACYRDSRLATVPLAVSSSRRGSLREAVSRARELIVLNESAKAIYESVMNRPVNLIPNFVEVEPEVVAPSTLGMDAWVYVGRLTPEKGVAELLDNWPSDEKIVIVGVGPLEDMLRRKYGRDPHVNIVGMVERPAVLDLIARSKGVVVPSLWSEGIPTVMLEALAVGVPLILSHKIAVAERFASAGVAVAIDVKSSSSVSMALSRVAIASEAMRRSASHFHEEHFSRASWLNSVEGLYMAVSARG